MKEKRTAEFIGSAFACVVGIAFVNTVPLWSTYTHGVVLDTWTEILWAANLALIVQVVCNLALALFRPPRVYSMLQTICGVFGLLSTVVFNRVFPLDFSRLGFGFGWLNSFVKVILIVAIVATAISIVVNGVRAMVGTSYSTAGNER